MRIDNFSDKEFVECLKLLVAPYKKKGSIESLLPIEIKDIQRTDSQVSIITSQLYANKYLLNRIYKFSDTEEDKIKIELIESESNDEAIDLSERVRPFLLMITKDDRLKGKDWLSRLSYNDYFYFINKYYAKCASLTFESNEQSPEHCRWVSLNDENGFYVGNTIVFGDYGIGYNHYGKLSKSNKQDVFDSKSLEFYYTILNRLNEFDRIEYTNQFITANISAYQISNSGKEFFDKETKKAKTIAQKLIDEAESKFQNINNLEK